MDFMCSLIPVNFFQTNQDKDFFFFTNSVSLHLPRSIVPDWFKFSASLQLINHPHIRSING